MCATSSSTLSNHQRYYYSLYAKSFTPLSCNLGLPRIRYSFLSSKISSKQEFQPTLYDGVIPSGCGYFPHTFIFSGNSRRGHQSGFSPSGKSFPTAQHRYSSSFSVSQHNAHFWHTCSGIFITNTAFDISHVSFTISNFFLFFSAFLSAF